MKKRDFFLQAMKAQEYRRAAWVISAFSLISEAPEDWKKNPYPYRIVQTLSGYFFVNPENINELIKIEDAQVGVPLFRMRSYIELKAGEVDNLSDDVTTTYGNVLYNYMCIVYPFGNKIPFLTGRWSPKKVESLIVDRFAEKQDVAPEERSPHLIYVDEYLRFTDAMFNLTAFPQLCVPACTEKTMTPPPGIVEFRTELLKKYEGRLHDPAVIAEIDAQIIQYLKDWMKNDPGMNFLINEKSFNVVRKKLFGIGGAEAGLDDNVSMDLITKSLSEGWQIDKFATLNTNSRAGSFNRGSQTELGGEAVKWLFRAASNSKVTADDCGSKLGITIDVPPNGFRDVLGFTAIISEDGSEQEKITSENVNNYLGKKVRLRSSMFCKLDKTDYCRTCLGQRLSTNPNGLGVAVAETGSIILNDFMKAMHGTAIEVRKLNISKHLR